MGIEESLPDTRWKILTEQDSPFYGRDPNSLTTFERWQHAQYSLGIPTLTSESGLRAAEEMNEQMGIYRRVNYRILHESE